ncbi:MAG: penicillin-binding protein [Spirochaetales bacterium]
MDYDKPTSNQETNSYSAPRGRYVALLVVLAAVIALLLMRYGELMLTPSVLQVATAPSSFERGPILDRHGRLLAVQSELETVWAWRPELDDAATLAAELAPIIEQDPSVLQAKLRGESGSATIKRNISPRESAAIRDAQADGRLAGIRLRPDYGRSYPERGSLGPVLGFVGAEGKGLTGIELTMEDELLSAERDAEYGNQVFLTIDTSLQFESERHARSALEEHAADSVTILTLDAKTADILAYVSVPSYDPNAFSQFSELERRNRPIADVYEPGSVFKIFSIGSFLQLGGISISSRFATDGSYDVTDPPITDLSNYGTVTTSDIIRLSSNVGAALASESVEARPFYNMLRLFGFAEETGIELNGEEAGLLARPDRWSGRTKPTLAIGQEIAVTALQLASAATVYANEGVLLKPNIVDKIVAPDGELVRDYGRTPVREVVDPRVAVQVLDAMERAVNDGGTARRLAYEGVRVAAKTGTAEKIDPRTGLYSSTEFVASTLAILPANDPAVIVYMMIDHPKGEEYYGGRIVTPVLRDYFDFLVPYLSIPVEGQQRVAHSGRVVVEPLRLPTLSDVVPDFTGLPKRALLPLLERDDVSVEIEGFGWVVSQAPSPGTPFRQGMTIRLELSE